MYVSVLPTETAPISLLPDNAIYWDYSEHQYMHASHQRRIVALTHYPPSSVSLEVFDLSLNRLNPNPSPPRNTRSASFSDHLLQRSPSLQRSEDDPTAFPMDQMLEIHPRRSGWEDHDGHQLGQGRERIPEIGWRWRGAG